MNSSHRSRAALVAAAALFLSAPALAQGNGQWFIPGQSEPRAHRPAHAHRSATQEPAALQADQAAAGAEMPGPGPAPERMQLPPAPKVPDVPRGAMPPAAVIGVLSVPDVLRASSAYREADRIIAERRQKLNEDAQKEQVMLRDLGQQLGNSRGKLSAEQLRQRDQELQKRITEERRKFSERGRIIQEASQYALAQIERTLSEVVQKVAGSRGMNLVLQRAEVALNQADFDITPQVASLLNKTLPKVAIPREGVEPPVVAAGSPSPQAEAAAENAVDAAKGTRH